MKHKYYIKHNGVLYAPGTDVPEGKAPVENVEQPKVEETKQSEVTENVEQPNTEENAEPPVEQPSYTRTQIQQMNSEDLRNVATELGLAFDEDSTNKELKQKIMGKLGI